MDPASPLRDVFAQLAGEGQPHAEAAEELLAAHGHAGLPDGLVAEAVVNFADTAPHEVAEHLAPFVKANSAVPLDDADADEDTADRGWFDLLSTAPEVDDLSAEPAGLDDEALDFASAASAAATQAFEGVAELVEAAVDAVGIDLEFGHGDTGAFAGPQTPPESPTPAEAVGGLPSGAEAVGAADDIDSTESVGVAPAGVEVVGVEVVGTDPDGLDGADADSDEPAGTESFGSALVDHDPDGLDPDGLDSDGLDSDGLDDDVIGPGGVDHA